jgi:hypothetical protein
MPTGSSFVALGRGNGFPFCLSTTAPTGTDVNAGLTRAQAMQAWWLPYSVELSVSWRSAWTDSSVSPEVWRDTTQNRTLSALVGYANPSATTAVEPLGRVCQGAVGDIAAFSAQVSPALGVNWGLQDIADASASLAIVQLYAMGDQTQTYPEQFLDLSSQSAALLNTQDTIDLSTPWGDVTLYGTSNVGGGTAADVFELLSASVAFDYWSF